MGGVVATRRVRRQGVPTVCCVVRAGCVDVKRINVFGRAIVISPVFTERRRGSRCWGGRWLRPCQ